VGEGVLDVPPFPSTAHGLGGRRVLCLVASDLFEQKRSEQIAGVSLNVSA